MTESRLNRMPKKRPIFYVFLHAIDFTTKNRGSVCAKK